MRRTVVLFTTVFVIISFLAHYPLTASAPLRAAPLSPLDKRLELPADLGPRGAGAAGPLNLRIANRNYSFGNVVVPVPKKASAVPAPLTPAAKADVQSPISSAIFSPSQNAARIAEFSKPAIRLPISPLTGQGASRQAGYCDANFVGEPISFTHSAELTLNDLLYHIHNRFGVNFIMAPGIENLPVNVRAGALPWNRMLNSQLFVLGVRATCIDQNTIQLVKNSDLPKLYETAEVKTSFIKLKFLQPTSSGNRNVAGQSSRSGGSQQGNCGGSGGGGGFGGGGGIGGGGGQQGCGNFEKLVIEIEKILGIRSMTQSALGNQSGGGERGNVEEIEPVRTNRSVSIVPGRNMLVVRATDDELSLINEIIRRADRPPFQVVIKGLVYTANEDRLRDIGLQTTIVDIGSDRTGGGIFGQPVGGAGSLFDFTTLVGSIDFGVQASALQRDGIISIKSRPFATVLDGDTADLTVGRQVPVLIQAITPVGGIPGTLQILQAANLLSVTPHVIDDENGNPIGVNLELTLESNDVDTSVLSQGVPSVAVRSIQSRFILNGQQTAILGGFTVDSDSRTVSQTPGLAQIPIIGELFKRRVRSQQVNRLYFAVSASVIPYPGGIEPVEIPGATTAPPSITDDMLRRGKEPAAVVPPKP